MALICGLVGVPSSGKTVIFNAITAAGATGYGGSEMNRMVINVTDSRLTGLPKCIIPRKLYRLPLMFWTFPD